MERYDADRSDGIDADEALLMLPQFKSVLKEASGLETDADLEAVLTYTLAKGETPTRTLFGAIGFMWWKTSRPLWDFQAPRMNLIKVFSAFVASPYQ